MQDNGDSPQNATAWARISGDKARDEHGVKDQVGELRNFGVGLGWKIKHVVKENDQSASKRSRRTEDRRGWIVMRTNRPKLDGLLRMIRNGETDGVLVRDLDRAVRDMRDLEDLIDACESRTPFVPVYSKYGRLQLRDTTEATVARLLATLAIDEAAKTARRIGDTKRLRAAEGKYRGGPRPYGFESDGITHRLSETAAIVWASDAVLDGENFGAICREMDRHGFPFGVKDNRRTAGQEKTEPLTWRATTLRAILLRARNAGLTEYSVKGKDGKKTRVTAQAEWEPIIPEDKWRAVCDILSNPERRTSPGPAVRHLGANIYYCGPCQDDGIVSRVKSMWGSDPDSTAYMCKLQLHLQLKKKHVDAFVIAAIIGKLSSPDAVLLLREEDDGPDRARLNTAAAAARRKLAEVNEAYKSGRENSFSRYDAVARDLERQIAEYEAALAAHSDIDPLIGIAGMPNAAEIWNDPDFSIKRKREIIRDLCEVTLYRPSRRLNQHFPFDPSTVRIKWLR